MRDLIAFTFSLLLWVASSANAGITIVDENASLSTGEKELSKKPALIKRIFKQKLFFQTGGKSFRPQWYEVHGSLNSHYVSVMVEKTQVPVVSGYLFDGQGNVEYVYGEWLQDYLQLYNQENNRLTVIIMDSAK